MILRRSYCVIVSWVSPMPAKGHDVFPRIVSQCVVYSWLPSIESTKAKVRTSLTSIDCNCPLFASMHKLQGVMSRSDSDKR